MFKMAENKEIIKTWLAGQRSCTLVIPKEFAKVYGLDEPSHVLIEGRPDGILIKRLELNGGDDDSDRNET
jgi:bifunctional DNA-binding transcriptional regulator/antitoxin component of YhaV-PrlF toxin-antitoxin module